MKTIFLLACVFFCGNCLAANPAAQYEKLFYDAIHNQLMQRFTVAPEAKDASEEERKQNADDLAQKFTICHMDAMNAYSLELQDAAFDVANSGGSYADAKQAFNSAVALEGAAGGKRENRVKRMLATAAMMGQTCLKDYELVE